MARIAFYVLVILAMLPAVTMLPSMRGTDAGPSAVAVPLAIRG